MYNISVERTEKEFTMKKTILIILLFSVLLLCGCSDGAIESPIDLIKKPRVPGDQMFPREQIYQEIPVGSKLIRPLKSNNLSAINYIEWDNNSDREIYAFYKIAVDNKIGVVLLINDGKGWQTLTTIEMAGSDIEFANFVDFNGDGVKDLILGLSMPSELFDALAVYQWQDGNYVEIYRDVYTNLTVEDVDDDGVVDILLLRLDRNKEAIASLISYQNDGFRAIDTIDLDEYIIGYYNVVFGKATAETTGLFIDKRLGSNYMTNIIVYRNGRLELAFDEQLTDQSRPQLMKPFQIASRDINNDGIIEIGNRIESPLQILKSTANQLFFDTWYRWDGANGLDLVLMVYENKKDGFRLTLPNRWAKAANNGQLVLIPARDKVVNRFLHIYYSVGEDEYYKLLTIEKIKKHNYQKKIRQLTENGVSYFDLASDGQHNFIAYFQKNTNTVDDEYRSGYEALFLTEEELRKSFQIIE